MENESSGLTFTVQERDTLVPAHSRSEETGSLASSSRNRSAAGVGHSAPVVSSATSDSKNGSQEKLQILKTAINDLVGVLENEQQRSVNNTTRDLARKVRNAFKSLQKSLTEEGTSERKLPINACNCGTTAKKELFPTPIGNLLPNSGYGSPKRKAGSPPDSEESRANKRMNQRKRVPTVQFSDDLQVTSEGSGKSTQLEDERVKVWLEQNPAWKTKERKKRKKRNQESVARIQWQRTRPAALLISAKQEKSYADILKKVKEEMMHQEVDENFEKVRRTVTGQLLIVSNRKIGDGMDPLYKKMEETLREEVVITCKVQKVKLQIRDCSGHFKVDRRTSLPFNFVEI